MPEIFVNWQGLAKFLGFEETDIEAVKRLRLPARSLVSLHDCLRELRQRPLMFAYTQEAFVVHISYALRDCGIERPDQIAKFLAFGPDLSYNKHEMQKPLTDAWAIMLIDRVIGSIGLI